MEKRINIQNWYQLDFNIDNPKSTLKKISRLADELISQNIFDKWYYLFEGNTIRVRLHSSEPQELEKIIKDKSSLLELSISEQHQFEGYWETTDSFEDVEVAEAFADIMSTLTRLTTARFQGKQFSNYRLVERLSHCIFNNVYGLPTEEYFLLKRLLERFGNNLDSLNDNPEQTILDSTINISSVQNISFAVPILKTPTK